MNYGSNQKGEAVLTLTPEEKRRFDAGEPVVKHSGDCRGRFKIVVKLTRPRSKAARMEGL
jgi:hypothetical protein